MRSTPWFLPAPIAKACPTKRLCGGSMSQVVLSLTLLSSRPFSPSRKPKCPQSSPPPAHRFPQPCRHIAITPVQRSGGVGSEEARQATLKSGIYPNEFSIVSPLFFLPASPPY